MSKATAFTILACMLLLGNAIGVSPPIPASVSCPTESPVSSPTAAPLATPSAAPLAAPTATPVTPEVPVTFAASEDFTDSTASTVGTVAGMLTVAISVIALVGTGLGAFVAPVSAVPLTTIFSFCSFIVTTGFLSADLAPDYREYTTGFGWAAGIINSEWAKEVTASMQSGSDFSYTLQGLRSTLSIVNLADANGIDFYGTFSGISPFDIFFIVFANYILLFIIVACTFIAFLVAAVHIRAQWAIKFYEQLTEARMNRLHFFWIHNMNRDEPENVRNAVSNMESERQKARQRAIGIGYMFVNVMMHVSAIFFTGITLASFSALSYFPNGETYWQLLAAAFFAVVCAVPAIVALYMSYTTPVDKRFTQEFDSKYGPFYHDFDFKNRVFFGAILHNIVINCFIATALYAHPEAQVVFLLISEASILWLMYMRQPYTNKHSGYVNIAFYSVRTLSAFFMIFFLEYYDLSIDSGESFSAFIMFVQLVPLILALGYVLYNVAKRISDLSEDSDAKDASAAEESRDAAVELEDAPAEESKEEVTV